MSLLRRTTTLSTLVGTASAVLTATTPTAVHAAPYAAPDVVTLGGVYELGASGEVGTIQVEPALGRVQVLDHDKAGATRDSVRDEHHVAGIDPGCATIDPARARVLWGR